MTQHAETADLTPREEKTNTQRPLTGQEFLDSLHDEREVWILESITKWGAFKLPV